MNTLHKYTVLIVCMLGLIGVPTWVDASHRSISSLDRKINKLDDDAVEEMAIPIMYGVSLNQIVDSFGDPRSGGRSHEGIDIFAARGTLIATPTEAVVTKIVDEDQGFGGLQVWTANPGKESFYYAHLNGIWPDLEVGDELEPGNIIGFVGNSGNASQARPHLHFGIYNEDRTALNPYNRITTTFSSALLLTALKEYLALLKDQLKNNR